MCIFAGCDYLKSLNGMGPKKAHAAIYSSVANRAPLEQCFVKAIQKLKMEGFNVPPTYTEDFRRAYLTFLHQRVYDCELERLVHLRPIPPELESADLAFLGADLPQDIAQAIASGDMNPNNHQFFEEVD